MKNFILCLAVALAAISVQAQRTSFETTEGYTVGEFIHGVNGWQETSNTSNYFSITDEKSSEGGNSLKINYDNSQPLSFADWNFAEPLPVEDNLEISMDVYPPGGSTTLYWKIMANDEYAAYIIIQESYMFPAVVNQVNPVPIAMAEINVNAFNEIKLSFNYTDQTITYYANGQQIHQDELWGSHEAIDKYSFEAFLFEDMYMDNFQTNTNVGMEKFNDIGFTHHIQNNTLNLQSDVKMDAIEIYHISGRLVHSEDLNSCQQSVAISSLTSAVHIARLKMNNQWYSFKFIK